MAKEWKPYPKQEQALLRTEFEVLYGGARGGGKTETGLVWIIIPAKNKKYRGLVIRKNAEDLCDWIDRAKKLWAGRGKWVGDPPEFRFATGAVIRTGHLKDEQAYTKYVGHEYHRILIEELTLIPRESDYLSLISSCRSTCPDLTPQVFLTTNPGGPGHQWVKRRFIDVAPWYTPYKDPISGHDRIFIHATIDDNPAWQENDPRYITFLETLPEPLKQAWRFGSWDIIAGAAFPEISRDVHMVQSMHPPAQLIDIFDFDKMTPKGEVPIFRSLDWGYARPFSVGWYFCDYEGRIYRYRELYGCKAPDEGVKMPAREVARMIRDIEEQHDEKIILAVADSSIWDKPGNQNETAEKLPSIAETMAEEGIYFDRELSILVKRSRLQGKHQFHERLRIREDGLPSFFVFDTCVHWWRTVPVLAVSPLNIEDVDTDLEDHAYDETRYMLSARPFTAEQIKPAITPEMFGYYQRDIMRYHRVKNAYLRYWR